jgi:branched-chain amino acid transport system substrate-binding protein
MLGARRVRRVAVFAASALVLTGAAGCGTAGEKASGPATAASTNGGAAKPTCGEKPGSKATGEPIAVGAVIGKSGPADLSNSALSAQAYFACVNANGGIGGRPIAYEVADDAWNPGKSSQVAKELVEDKRVVALISSFSFFDCAVNGGYYESKNVLSIVAVGATRECFHSRNIAPINQGPRLSGIGAAQYAVEKGAKSLSCVGNVLPNFGKWVCDGITEWGKQKGIKVESFLGKPDASDAQTITIQALNADTDAVVVVDVAPAIAAYLKAAEQQNTKKPWYGPTSAYDLAFPELVGDYWNDKFDVQFELAPLDSESEGNQEWRAVMDGYASDSAPRDSFSQAGYLGARIFVEALKGMEPGQIDRDSVTKALLAVEDFRTDLLCKPWYVGDGDEHNANNVGRAVKLTGSGPTGFETVKDCYPVEDPDLTAIRAAENG